MIAEGLIGHRNAYLWSTWNWLDFVVVVVGWLTLTGATTGGMSALRSVRVLRPLRTITRVRGMKARATLRTPHADRRTPTASLQPRMLPAPHRPSRP